jgi:hypothetical protein
MTVGRTGVLNWIPESCLKVPDFPFECAFLTWIYLQEVYYKEKMKMQQTMWHWSSNSMFRHFKHHHPGLQKEHNWRLTESTSVFQFQTTNDLFSEIELVLQP